jgi:hypothetical protein
LKSPGRLVLGALVAVLLTIALGALSRVPAPGIDSREAALRLSWRLRSEETGECRRPTAEELQDLPSHMQNPDACAGVLPAYRLQVEVDGNERFDDLVEASGARGDRPLFVYREVRLPPGQHSVRVQFSPEEAGDAIELFLDASVSLGPGDVRLVTRNEDTGELEIARPRG